MTMIRVFLLDDHELVRRGLLDLLSAQPDIYVVGESGSARNAVERILRLEVDVAILDGVLPDGSGIEVSREVRAARPDTAVLILTSFDDEDALLASALAGASGYLLKQIRAYDLVETLHRVASGESLLDRRVTRRALARARDPESRPRAQPLEPREERVFDLMADGLTNLEISRRMDIPRNAVTRDVSSLLAKLGLRRHPPAATFPAGTHKARRHTIRT